MADLIVSTNYESERVLKAYSDDRQQLAFVIKSVPNSTDTWFISKFALFVDKSEFETGVESDVIIQEQQTSYYVEPDGSVTISFRVVSMPEELSGLMLANSLRTVPVSVRLQYRLSNGSLWHVGKFQLNNTVILGHEYLPQIPVFSVLRTDGGIPSDEGEDATVKMQLSYAPETITQLMALRLHYAEGRDATLADEYLVLDSRITTEEFAFVLGNKFSNSVDWGFLLYFGDKYENITASSNIFKAFANMHLSGAANGGVCFGGFSKSTYEQPMFECYYPAYFYGGIVQGGGGGGDYPAPGTELNTGSKWFNGKPIYRAIIETGAKTANTMNYDVSAFDIEHYISIRGMFYAQADYADGYVFPAPAAHMNNVNWTIQLEATDRTKVTTGATSRTWKSGWIMIEYTKAG